MRRKEKKERKKERIEAWAMCDVMSEETFLFLSPFSFFTGRNASGSCLSPVFRD